MTESTHTTFRLNGNIYLQEWRTNDLMLHKIDGPALIIHCVNGQIVKKYYLYDIHITREIQDWLIENNITAPYSEEDQMAILLRWK